MPALEITLEGFIGKIEEFAKNPLVEQFRKSSKVKGSISKDPFSETELTKLIEKLKNPKLSTFEREWLLKEHLLWASASFPNEKATILFEQLLNENVLQAIESKKDGQAIQVAINFNGTNNLIQTKKNRNDELIEGNPYDFKIQIPGVGSSPTLKGDPVGLVEQEMKKYKDDKNNPFSKILESIKPRLSDRLARALFGGLVRKMRILRGNGTFYASLYAAMKVYELHKQYPDRAINLDVFGHSRGSVSALFFNLILKQLIDNGSLSPTISVVQALNDPVPGGDLSNPDDYKNSLKDHAFDRFKSLYPDFAKGAGMVEALHQTTQPKLVKKSLITYPVGETRVVFAPLLSIPFDEATQSNTVLSPGSHNEPVYGDYAVGIYSLNLRKESAIIANNISSVQDNHRRRHIAIFYKHLTELFLNYSKTDTTKPFHECLEVNKAKQLIETYAKFMVEGYAKNILTDNYLLLQTNQARDPMSLKGSSMPQYFMDNVHENLFKVQYPSLYESLKTKQSVDLIKSNPEFKDLPISMKRVLTHKNQTVEPTQLPKPKTVDSKLPLGYLASAFLGLKKRFWNLFNRESTAYARIPLETRYREDKAEAAAEKTRPLFNKLPMKKLKYLASTTKMFDLMEHKKAIENELHNNKLKLSKHEKNFRLKKIELIDMLEYYKEKSGTDNPKLPTPLYLFYQKCPDLLPVYLASPQLRKMWHCDELDKECPLEEQISLLEFYQVVENKKDGPIADLSLEDFKKLNREKSDIEKHIKRKIKHVDDIDGREEQIRDSRSSPKN